MTRNGTTSGNDQSQSEDDALRKQAHAWNLLSRRMVSWSGNLLATAVIVVLGLTFGRQVLQWWSGEPPTMPAVQDDLASPLGGLADPGIPHLLAFGDLPLAFDRAEFEGTEQQALAHLRGRCRALAVAAEAEPSSIPVSEQQLARLALRQPFELDGNRRILQQGGPVITVVVLQMGAPETGNRGDVASQFAESVVSWGLGLRSAKTETEASNRWTLFTCSGQSQKVDSDLGLSLPLPPGSRRTLAMQVLEGGGLIGFTGTGSTDSSRLFFDTSFEERGWQRSAGWSRIGASWHARFQKRDTGTCDIRLIENAEGDTSGILTVSATIHASEK